ncbi:hypothetical protein F9K33_09745 [bacterium]|nr:MAG: hypothetical protein F9K33_09745 [bacterium]
MRQIDGVYFSPTIRFGSIDFEERSSLIPAVRDRIYGYYLDPVKVLIEREMGFAAGVLLISAIDGIAEMMLNDSKSADRLIPWLSKYVNEFSQADTDRPGRKYANTFNDFFRHKLIHNSRIAEGGQFSLLIDDIMTIKDKTMIVNPFLLLAKTCQIFDSFCEELRNTSTKKFELLSKRCLKNFKKEIELDMSWQ